MRLKHWILIVGVLYAVGMFTVLGTSTPVRCAPGWNWQPPTKPYVHKNGLLFPDRVGEDPPC